MPEDLFRRISPEQRQKLYDARKLVQERWNRQLQSNRPVKLLTNTLEEQSAQERKPSIQPLNIRLRRRFRQQDGRGRFIRNTI